MMYGFDNEVFPIMGLQTHGFLTLILLLGVILFAVWAIKNLKNNALMTLAVILIIVGILGSLFTGGWGYSGFRKMMGNGNFETMLDRLNEEDYSGVDTPDEMRDRMIENMREYMGIE